MTVQQQQPDNSWMVILLLLIPIFAWLITVFLLTANDRVRTATVFAVGALLTAVCVAVAAGLG